MYMSASCQTSWIKLLFSLVKRRTVTVVVKRRTVTVVLHIIKPRL